MEFITIPTTNLPETVRQAWGPDVAEAFTVWLSTQLKNSQIASSVQISPLVARQKVNVLLLERISNLLLAGEPTLTQTSPTEWAWHVPIDLTFPSHGRVGQVGELIVDAHYGEIRYTQALLTKITTTTEQLAEQI